VQRDIAKLPREGRPLSQSGDLADMQRVRAPLYARFRDAWIVNNTTQEEAAARIWQDFCENAD
jgi:hypothetical protein